jgi:predicted N-acetyltransferase YhbS
MNIKIRVYQSADRQLIEDFREKTFSEDNESLSIKKYDPDNLIGQTVMLFIEDELASISVVESSIKYTQT